MNFAQILFPDFSLILIGYLVCRFTPLDRSVWEKIELLVYYFLFPVLLFYSARSRSRGGQRPGAAGRGQPGARRDACPHC